MSSSDRMLRRARPALALAAALMLGGCFRPMYANVSPSGVNLADTMASVTIAPASGRVAQQVRNNLDFALTGGGERAVPRYTLTIGATSTRTSSIVDVQTNEPQIDTVTVTGTFALTPIGGDGARSVRQEHLEQVLSTARCSAMRRCARRATRRTARPRWSPTRSDCGSRPILPSIPEAPAWR